MRGRRSAKGQPSPERGEGIQPPAKLCEPGGEDNPTPSPRTGAAQREAVVEVLPPPSGAGGSVGP